jgi:hypothetical protein
MKFKIEFDCDNAVFNGDNLRHEAARILHACARMVEQDYVEGAVIDENGNRVGYFEFINRNL